MPTLKRLCQLAILFIAISPPDAKPKSMRPTQVVLLAGDRPIDLAVNDRLRSSGIAARAFPISGTFNVESAELGTVVLVTHDESDSLAIEAVARLTALFQQTFPTVVLTDQMSWAEKIEFVKAGSTEHFHMSSGHELRAVIDELAERWRVPFTACGLVAIDNRNMSAHLNGKPIDLLPQDIRMVRLLANTPTGLTAADLVAALPPQMQVDDPSQLIEDWMGSLVAKAKQIGEQSPVERVGSIYRLRSCTAAG
jgi:DNA-binding response OmpR family regulator